MREEKVKDERVRIGEKVERGKQVGGEQTEDEWRRKEGRQRKEREKLFLRKKEERGKKGNKE